MAKFKRFDPRNKKRSKDKNQQRERPNREYILKNKEFDEDLYRSPLIKDLDYLNEVLSSS